MIGRLMLAAIMGPVLFTLIIGFINHPEWLLVPLGLIGAVLLIAFIYGATTAVKQKPFPGDQLDLPPASLTPPQSAMTGARSLPEPTTVHREAVPTTVPGDALHTPGYGNLLRYRALRRLPANWRYRSPRMRPPADGSPPA